MPPNKEKIPMSTDVNHKDNVPLNPQNLNVANNDGEVVTEQVRKSEIFEDEKSLHSKDISEDNQDNMTMKNSSESPRKSDEVVDFYTVTYLCCAALNECWLGFITCMAACCDCACCAECVNGTCEGFVECLQGCGDCCIHCCQ